MYILSAASVGKQFIRDAQNCIGDRKKTAVVRTGMFNLGNKSIFYAIVQNSFKKSF